MSNINDTYFDGHYKQIWKSIIPDELTMKEIDFMMQYFQRQPGSHVLDLMCGYGRHSLALAKKEIEVTAVDNLPDYINEVRNNAEAENLPVHPVLEDVMLYEPAGNFDLTICMGNSLQFFDKADVMKLLKKISTHLNTGGYFREKSWSMNGDLKFLVDSKFLFSPNRIEAEHQIIAPDGTTEVKQSVDYIWSLNEIETMLGESGMKMTEVFSIPGRKKFTLGEPRAYIVAQKN
jgi:SAM-dependent methyltransferase